MSIRLGVNIDHVATLRQVRKARYPDIVEALHLCERGGADQITVHLREDRRHIQDHDVERLLECSLLPINLEMALSPEMVALAIKWQPYSVTLVPERREEMTTESGLNLIHLAPEKKKMIQALKESLRVVSFLDPELDQLEASRDLGIDAVELHTGPFSFAYEKSLRGKSNEELQHEMQRLEKADAWLYGEGLEIRAGHGLTVQNLQILKTLPHLIEVNIGHSIVARSILMGLEAAVREMRDALAR